MENEWVVGIGLTVLVFFCVVVTLLVKSAKRKIEESEGKKELLRSKILLIKDRWKFGK